MSSFYHIPVTLNPPIKTYPGYAFVLSMLFAKSEEYFPWLLNHYIIPIGNEYGTRYEFMPTDPFCVSEGVMQYMSTNIAPELLCEDRIFFNYVVAMLHQGFGLTCWMNEKYIPNRHAYQYYDYIHDNMIVGYKKEPRAVVVLGYSPSGRYETSVVGVDQLVSSLKNNKQPQVSLNFIRPNSSFKPKFIFEDNINQIKNYLDAPSIKSMGFSMFYGISSWETGIAATNKLNNYPIETTGHYDLRLYSFLRDRVSLMYERVEYMMRNGYINENYLALEKLSHAKKLAISTHLLAIKYNMLHNESCTLSIKRYIEKIIKIEEDVLYELLADQRMT